MTSASTRRLLAFVSALAVLLLGSLTAGTAHAEAPFHLPTQVVDPAGVLDDAQRIEVAKTVSDLEADQEIAYWVVFVKSFGGLSPQEWTSQTVAQSDFGTRDVVLAIATDEKTSFLQAPLEVDGLTDSEIAAITADDLAPAVQKGQFAQAALSVGSALESAADDDSSSRTGLIATVVIVGVLALAGVALYIRKRRADAEVDESLSLDELGRQPLDELDAWSREVLTGTDRAIATSADELALAVDELGASVAQPFTDAVLDARAALAEAFTARQRIDDGLVADPDEQRRLLVQIITTCSRADTSLDGQVTGFDGLRNLLADPGARLDALTARITELTARVPRTRARLDELIAEHGDDAASIVDNVSLAAEQIQFAEDATAQGRDAAAAGAQGRGSVVGAIRSAEGALEQAAKLLDAVDDADPSSTDDVALPAVIDRVQAVSDYVATRRGVVGAVARTRLSEARRLADTAADLLESNTPGSAETAARASVLADQALAQAQYDVAEWFSSQRADPADGYGDLAPVLTGILVDTVWNDDVHAGGYSHDGRSPASYGGSSSSGRIGVGGRI
ncbi:hypothetical protein nbrc107696_11200 [Gordonia spumicola]|uniref:TPM domain-containing protein n=1 Tax=Gordonia spumicola TaxID=589161 RepID=A0A7I9V631_9ACTN|nr:TPM domain-containing protein [Gordonia spumicola]GEE00674.1 hypothetical protein nbrc107696_11200 [Gordonia spumicola]